MPERTMPGTTPYTQPRGPERAIEAALRLAHASIFNPRKNPPMEALQRITAVLEHTKAGGNN